MKLYNFTTLLGIALATISCTEKIAAEESGKEQQLCTFSASLSPTKVLINGEGKSEWEKSDEICVLCNGESGKFASSGSGAVVDFTGYLTVTKGYDFWGVYPFSSVLSGTQKDVTVNMPATQTVKPGSYANIVKIAVSSTTDLYFRNTCGCLKFKVSQPGISRLTLRSVNSSYLAGQVRFEWNEGLPVVSSVENGSDVLTIEPEGGEFVTDTYYYVAVLPTEQDSFVLTFEKGKTLGSVTKGPYAFKRNKNLLLDSPDAEAVWEGEVRTYDFTTSPNWDLCKTAVAENTTYSVKENGGSADDFVYYNCYSSSTNSGATKYLVISKGYLGLPVLKGYRLSAVEMTLGNHNANRTISVNTNQYTAAILTGGGSLTTVLAAATTVRFELPNTIEGQQYWLYSGSTFVLGKLKLYYEPATVVLEDVDKVIARAIKDGTIPGAVLGIWKDGSMVYEKAYGNKSVTPAVVPMTTDVVFDMASCSKVMSTTIAVMQQYEKGEIDFDEKLSTYLSEFPKEESIKIMDLLTHVSGLVRATTDYKLYAGNPQGFLEATAVKARSFEPGAKYDYNCINFYCLKEIIERQTSKRLCDYAKQNIYEPLGMDDTMYLPTTETIDPAYKARIAPTSSKTSMIGIVNDSMARIVNEGNAGNAGVFSTLEDVIKFGRALLAGGILNGNRILNESTVETMSQVVNPAIGRTPGWDCQSPTGYEKGNFISRDAIFHTGYTGTMIVVDRKNNLCIVLLANRSHPQNTGYDAWNRYRGLACDIIGSALCK